MYVRSIGNSDRRARYLLRPSSQRAQAAERLARIRVRAFLGTRRTLWTGRGSRGSTRLDGTRITRINPSRRGRGSRGSSGSRGSTLLDWRAAAPGSSPCGAARAEEVVRRRQDDAPEPIGIVRRQLGEEARDHLRGGRGAVPAERRVHPALREEDVAGPLDLPQQRRGSARRTSPTPRRAADDAGSSSPSSTHGSRRRFATSSSDAKNSARAPPDRPRAPACTNAKRALRSGFSMRASCSSRIVAASRAPRARPAPAPARCRRARRAAGPGTVSLASPHARRASRAWPASARRRAARRTTPPSGSAVGAASSPSRSACSSRGARRRVARRRQEPPEGLPQRSRGSAATFSSSVSRGSARARGRVDAARRARRAVEHRVPQRDPRAAARQRDRRSRGRCARQVASAGRVEHEARRSRGRRRSAARSAAPAARAPPARRRARRRGATGSVRTPVGVAERDLQLLRSTTSPRPRIGIALRERQPRDAAVVDGRARS